MTYFSLFEWEGLDLWEKYLYSLSCQELDEKPDTTLTSVHWIWSYSQEAVSLA